MIWSHQHYTLRSDPITDYSTSNWVEIGTITIGVELHDTTASTGLMKLDLKSSGLNTSGNPFLMELFFSRAHLVALILTGEELCLRPGYRHFQVMMWIVGQWYKYKTFKRTLISNIIEFVLELMVNHIPGFAPRLRIPLDSFTAVLKSNE